MDVCNTVKVISCIYKSSLRLAILMNNSTKENTKVISIRKLKNIVQSRNLKAFIK